MSSSATPVVRLQPDRTPFLVGRFLPAVLFLGLVALVGAVAAVVVGEAILGVGAVALAVLLGLPSVIGAFVAFKKESYELHDTFIRATRGGLFSDQTTELDIRNITHVKQRLHWLRWRVFGVGDLLVESAGSADSEVHMLAMRESDKLYDDLRALMRKNGYALKQQRVLHQEQPDKIGVALELVGMAFGGLMATGFTLVGFIADDKGGGAKDVGGVVLTLITLFGAVAAVGGLFLLVVRWLDLRRRTYTVYDDAVVYEEGFLSRNNAFIPYENVADAEAKRTLVDQILGLTNVKVSCQGGGSEVLFKYLRRGDALMGAVSELVESARQAERLKDAAPRGAALGGGTSPGAGDADPGAGRKLSRTPDLVPPEQVWTAELSMSLPRALLAVLPLIVFPPAALVAGVGLALKVMATRYSVRRSSVRSTFKLLSVDEREFAYDKITGLVIEENILDRLMNTVSVKLWSIGSPLPLEMLYLKRDTIDLDAIRRQVGIPAPSASPYQCTTTFGLGAWVRGSLGRAIGVVPVLIVLVVVAFIVHPALLALLLVPLVYGATHFIYRTFYFRYQKVELHDEHLFAQTGRLIQRQYFVRYPNIKKVQRTRYPGGDEGSLTIFVAGEQIPPMAKNNKNAKGNAGMRVPYAFTAHYLDDVEPLSDLVDDVMRGRVLPERSAHPAPAAQVIREAQPAVANGLVVLVLSSLVTVVGAVFLPISIPWMVMYLKRKRYDAEDARVTMSWGILYKSRASILYDRIDSLKESQGLLGKMFKNGKITVLTAGSSNPDLVLADIPQHKAFYEVVRKHYAN